MKILETLTSFQNFIAENSMVLALISDIGCNVCLAITPELEEMSQRYTNVEFVSVDTNVVPEITGDQLVFVYPTLVVFAEGKETMRFERVFSMLDVEAHIERLASILFD